MQASLRKSAISQQQAAEQQFTTRKRALQVVSEKGEQAGI